MRATITTLLIALSLCLRPCAAAEEEHTHVAIKRDASLTWIVIVEQALLNSTAAPVGSAREQQSRAYEQAARSFIVGSPEFEINHYQDKAFDDTGLEEWEVGFNVGLWRVGQRRDAKKLGRTLTESSNAWRDYQYWEVAGQVRQLFYQLAQAEISVEQERRNVRAASDLVSATEILQQAGSVAMVDVMQIKNLELQHRQLLLGAEAELVDAQRNYAVYTGLTRLPENLLSVLPKLQPGTADEETIAELEQSLPQQHPWLAYLRSQEKVSDYKIKQQLAAAKGSPKVSLSVRRERADAVAPEIDSLGVSVAIPFGGGSHARAATSDLVLEKAQTASQWQQALRDLNVAIHEVEHELSVVAQSLVFLNEQLQINRNRWQLAQTAFENGETNLTDTLWVLREVIDSESRFAEVQLRQQALYSEYHQTLGARP